MLQAQHKALVKVHKHKHKHKCFQIKSASTNSSTYEVLEAQVQSTTVQPFYHLSCMNKNVNFQLVNKYIHINKFKLIINFLLKIFVVASNKH